jgi:putative hydrolase of HD superfamily
VTARLDQQIAFLNEADKLKSITRATTLADGSRAENSAEHSWHLTLYALVLADQAKSGVDITRVIKMLILHDLVEIDAGDNPIFDDVDVDAMEAAEQVAADRILGYFPAIYVMTFVQYGTNLRRPKLTMPNSPNLWIVSNRQC